MSAKYDILTIVGPTACGKTAVAVRVASRLNAVVLSADSRQVYRGMDIGTGKDLAEYQYNGSIIPYELIDICDAGEEYNVFSFQRDFFAAYQRVCQSKRLPLLCGGSGLYLEAVLKSYQMPDVPVNAELRESMEGVPLSELKNRLAAMKTLHNTTDVDSSKRAIRAIEIANYAAQHPVQESKYPLLRSLTVGLDVPRDVRRQRISTRLKQRLEHGMIEEVERLLAKGVDAERLIAYGLEYKYITRYLQKEITYNEMQNLLEIAIHQFAKRQMTWLRGMERRGVPICWIDAMQPIENQVSEIIDMWNK